MKERPIIFSTDMVQAILDGRKTQTRRVVSPKTSVVGSGKSDWLHFCWDGSAIYKDTCRHGHTEIHKAPLPFIDGHANEYVPYEHQYLHVPYRWQENCTIYRIYPKWDVGDRLWVRETWCELIPEHYPPQFAYKASNHFTEDSKIAMKELGYRWKPSIHMPRWASRITLEITEVRVERLQEITLNDAMAEGYTRQYHDNYDCDIILWFHNLWDSLNAKSGYGWDTNPWVWVIGFKVL